MNLGIEDLDAEHRHLYELLEEVTVHVEDGNVSGARVLAEELLIATDENFRGEEASMVATAYPRMAEHLRSHGVGRRFLRELVAATRDGRMVHAQTMIQQYAAHHFRHLIVDDGLLAEWLKDNPSPSAWRGEGAPLGFAPRLRSQSASARGVGI